VGSAVALAVSTVVTYVVERAIIYVLGDAVTAAGGSVAAGTAGGAAAGSWVPGAGTAIGAAAGLLAGAAVDIWLSHRNKTKTAESVKSSLSQIEDSILKGDKKQLGMRQVLGEAGTEQANRLGDKLKQQLAEAAK
jgi:hypothetical protein